MIVPPSPRRILTKISQSAWPPAVAPAGKTALWPRGPFSVKGILLYSYKPVFRGQRAIRALKTRERHYGPIKKLFPLQDLLKDVISEGGYEKSSPKEILPAEKVARLFT